MVTSIFQFGFDQIGFDINSVYKMLRMDPKNVPEPYPTIVVNEISQLKDKFEIQGGYQIFDDVKIGVNTIQINQTVFNVGKNLSVYLKNAEKIVLFLCTAGAYVTERSKRYSKEGQLLESYIVDIIGTVVVETAMDKIHAILTEEQNKSSFGVSNRYSPGYCNWDVSEQHKLFSFFPENFCDICLSENALMHPIKSISGLIGVGTEIRRLPYLCLKCSSTNCIYRNITS